LGSLVVQETPLALAAGVSRWLGCEVWVKRDGRTHPTYGGNKVRKLVHLLDEASRRGATHLVTVGAAGSNHAVATAVHGGAAGYAVEVVLAPQHAADYAVDNLHALRALGARVWPAPHAAAAPGVVLARLAALRAQGHRPFYIPPGGSNAVGARGYRDAAAELARQARTMGIAGFDATACALGSGGTLAGLAAGWRDTGLGGALVGVRVVPWPWVTRRGVVRCARALTAPAGPYPVTVDDTALGDGYGHPTQAGAEALARFADDGIPLEPTYSAKAAAGLVARVRRDPGLRRVLLWATWSETRGPGAGLPASALPLAWQRLLRAA